MWKQFFRVARQKTVAETADPSLAIAARHWCEERAISIAEAVERLTGTPAIRSIESECPAEVAAGRAAQDSCPAKMGAGANTDLLYSLAEGIECTKAIETGVAFGWSSFALLQSVSKRGGKLVSTDMPYPLRENDRFVGCVVPPRLRRHWRLLRYPDRDGLPMALGELGTIDLCHYDSDKSEAGRLFAYPLLWDALRPGGFFLSDDVQDNFGYRDFCASLGLAPLVVKVPDVAGSKFVGIAVHP